MPQSEWRSTQESCLDGGAFFGLNLFWLELRVAAQAGFASAISNLKLQVSSSDLLISNFKSEISNQGCSGCGLVFRRGVRLPEIGICSRKRDAGLDGSA